MSITLQLPNGQQVTVEASTILIGRDPSCTIALPDEIRIQPCHATIRKVAGRWMIQSEGDWLLQVGKGVPGGKCWVTPGEAIHLTEAGPTLVFMPSDATHGSELQHLPRVATDHRTEPTANVSDASPPPPPVLPLPGHDSPGCQHPGPATPITPPTLPWAHDNSDQATPSSTPPPLPWADGDSDQVITQNSNPPPLPWTDGDATPVGGNQTSGVTDSVPSNKGAASPPVPVTTPTFPLPSDSTAKPVAKPIVGSSFWGHLTDKNHPASKIAGGIVSVLVLLGVCNRLYLRYTGKSLAKPRPQAASMARNAMQMRNAEEAPIRSHSLGKELVFNGDRLFYTPPVTETEANRLGQYLVADKFFDGKRTPVQIQKLGNTYEFHMVVKKGIEQDREAIDDLKAMGGQLSENVFNNSPVDIHLCDDNFKTLRVVLAGEGLGKELTFNGGQLFYKPPVTEAEANRLGEFLGTEVFDGQRKTVQIKKEDETYQFRMVIKKGIEQDREIIDELKGMCGELSKNVFNGARVEIHLCDDYLSTIRVVVPVALAPEPQGQQPGVRGGRYEQVRSGMSRAQVEAILGAGREVDTTETDGTTITTVVYEDDGAMVSILYWDGRVKTKSKTASP